jgi:alpha-tubulin suppressor-like RCC1 family protein
VLLCAGLIPLSGCVADPPPVIGAVFEEGDGRVRVSWSAPLGGLGFPITGYRVLPFIGTQAQTPVSFLETSTSQVVTGLQNGVEYRFAVAALNLRGDESAYSELSDGVTPNVGIVWSWGRVGPAPDFPQDPSPVSTGMHDFAQIASGGMGGHAAAIDAAGALWTWGDNQFGQLGVNDTVPRTVPTQVASATPWKSVSVGAQHTLGLKTDDTLWSWGNNNGGQLGLGLGGTAQVHVPTKVPGTPTIPGKWQAIAAGDIHSVAIAKNGTLWAWGVAISSPYYGATPIRIDADPHWKTIAAGAPNSVALKDNGSLWTFGFEDAEPGIYNRFGELGHCRPVIPPGEIHRIPPTQVGAAEDWDAVSAGASHMLAKKTDGRLYGWGANTVGQLGQGFSDEVEHCSPIQVGTANWQSISAGGNSNAAIKDNKTLWTWGQNTTQQLGLNVDPGLDVFEPTQVGTRNDWKAAQSYNSGFMLGLTT